MQPKTLRRSTGADRERGSAMLIAVLALLIIATIGISTSQVASTELEVAANYQQSWAAFYAADGAAHMSFADMIALAREVGRFPEQKELDGLPESTVRNAVIRERTMAPTAAAVRSALPTGYYQGMIALTRPYEVTLTAETDSYPRASAAVTMGMFFDIIPVFQFAIFYENDLELIPGPAMTLSGRVHSNSDIYFAAENSLTIDSNVTAAGDIFNRRKDSNRLPPGAVKIRDGQGSAPAMAGLDSTNPEWTDEALSRWRGNVRSADHGIPRLNLTISDPSNPHVIIEPAYADDTSDDRIAKIYNDSEMSLRVLNGNGFDADGQPVDASAALQYDVLFDQREQKHMLLVEVDVSKLPLINGFPTAGNPAAVYVGSFPSGNGIPEWNIVDPAEWKTAFDEFNEWLETKFGGSVPQKMTVAASHVLLASTKCQAGQTNAAGAQIQAAGNQLDSAAKGRKRSPAEITTAERDLLKAMLVDLGNCEGGSGVALTWPEAWTGYAKPVPGGTTEYAVKVYGGGALVQPLTIVTANPAYIRGDYNSVNKKPAALIADAITILSNAWGDDDLTYSKQSLGSRTASNTTQNVAFMLGNTETKTGSYNGGVENLPRFLENWSGRTFRYRGSLIDVWYSQSATGRWGQSNVYSPPVRDWEFDTDLLDPTKIPPATPEVYTVRMKNWIRH